MFWGERIIMQTTTSWRSRFAVAGVTAAVAIGLLAAPSPAMAAQRTAITVAKIAPASGKTIVAGENIVISGKTSANLKGWKLKVQAKVGTKWQTLSASPTVTTKLTYAAKVKAVGVGATSYRVLFAGSKSRAASSATRAATVWKWFPLAGQKVVDYKASLGWAEPRSRPTTMAGVYYPEAILGKSRGNRVVWSEFNVSFQCQSLSALVGISDDSPSDSAGMSTVSVDGVTPAGATAQLKLGKTQPVKISVADSMRVRLTLVSPSDGQVEGVWANAKILCKKNVNPVN
ncbi:NPCBM/NEW2 domain-containing protein [Microbacterium oleivorans]|uniref:NPCBM/NEW2 domain-containing protein n=1 Tax=Microbacterium oleivorans TaxID=273677 RepID=UPI000767AB15|nr:NPCBM/NEW2 domain-containing protein [Microbacterium oleivorans]